MASSGEILEALHNKHRDSRVEIKSRLIDYNQRRKTGDLQGDSQTTKITPNFSLSFWSIRDLSVPALLQVHYSQEIIQTVFNKLGAMVDVAHSQSHRES